MIVTGRDFRANQSKYIGYAHNGEDVILKSRAGSVRLIPVDATEATEQELNRVYIEDGEVKMELQSDTMSIDEAKRLTMKMIDLEYALP
jgi:antitoxin (DNA-binding transcriptional repressor) of toxin-antitoxin stability system